MGVVKRALGVILKIDIYTLVVGWLLLQDRPSWLVFVPYFPHFLDWLFKRSRFSLFIPVGSSLKFHHYCWSLLKKYLKSVQAPGAPPGARFGPLTVYSTIQHILIRYLYFVICLLSQNVPGYISPLHIACGVPCLPNLDPPWQSNTPEYFFCYFFVRILSGIISPLQIACGARCVPNMRKNKTE